METNAFFDGFAQSDSAVVESEPRPAAKAKAKKPADIVA